MSRNILHNDEFFSRVDKIRLHYGLKQNVFSELTGISNAYYSDMKNGRVGPSANFIYGIVKNFDKINPKWLITGEGEMFLPENTRIKETGAAYSWSKEILDTLANLSPERRNAIISLIDNMIKLTDNK